MMAGMDAPELLTTSDVARAGKVTPDTARVWERTGKLHAIKTRSGQRLFLSTEVDRFLAERAAPKAAIYVSELA